jgi:hypothetical protein
MILISDITDKNGIAKLACSLIYLTVNVSGRATMQVPTAEVSSASRSVKLYGI